MNTVAARVLVVSDDADWLQGDLAGLVVERLRPDDLATHQAGNATVVVLRTRADLDRDLSVVRLRDPSAVVVLVPGSQDEHRSVRRSPHVPVDAMVLAPGATDGAVCDAVWQAMARRRNVDRREHTLSMISHEPSLQRARSERRPKTGGLDGLTGLADRERLIEFLSRYGKDAGCGVLFVDVDHFKRVNDEHGHAVGDDVLRAVAERLQRVVRPGDLVGRIGGDEFAIVLTRSSEEATPLEVAQRIVSSFTEPIRLPDLEVAVTVSIGVSMGSADDPVAALSRADVAMYRSKADGRATVRVHDNTLRRADERMARLSEEIPGALDRGAIRAHLDPISRLADGREVGVRARLVWDRAGGELEAREVLSAAVRGRQLGRVEASFGESAFTQFRSVAAEHHRLVYPIRPGQLGHGAQSAERLLSFVFDAGVEPERVTFELSTQDAMRAMTVCSALTGAGARLSLRLQGAEVPDLSHVVRASITELAISSSVLADGPGRLAVRALTAAASVLDLDTLLVGPADQEAMTDAHAAGIHAACGAFVFVDAREDDAGAAAESRGHAIH